MPKPRCVTGEHRPPATAPASRAADAFGGKLARFLVPCLLALATTGPVGLGASLPDPIARPIARPVAEAPVAVSGENDPPPPFSTSHASLKAALEAVSPEQCRDAAGHIARAKDSRAFRTLLAGALDTAERLASLDAAHAALLQRLERSRERLATLEGSGRAAFRDLSAGRKALAAVEAELDAHLERIHQDLARAAADAIEHLDATRRSSEMALLDRRATRARHEPGARTAVAILECLPADAAIPRLAEMASYCPSTRARVSALRGLGRCGADPSRLAGPASDENWCVRAAAHEALAEIGTPQARVVLTNARACESDGRLAADLDECLAAWPEAKPPPDAGADNEAGDEPATSPERVGTEPESETGAVPPPASRERRYAFYGIESPSRRVVFVVDVSGSMEERTAAVERRKIDRAMEELDRAIDALPGDARFDVVLFGDRVREFSDGLAPADPATRRRAQDFAEGAEVRGGTNLFDALRHAGPRERRTARHRVRALGRSTQPRRDDRSRRDPGHHRPLERALPRPDPCHRHRDRERRAAAARARHTQRRPLRASPLTGRKP